VDLGRNKFTDKNTTILVAYATPSLSSNSPGQLAAGYPVPLKVNVTGAGFFRQSFANWNSIPLATTFVSSIELTATNPAPDPSGHGQGRTYLGTISVTTDSSGNASFTATGLASLTAGQRVTDEPGRLDSQPPGYQQ
jgi:hypothetical protein